MAMLADRFGRSFPYPAVVAAGSLQLPLRLLPPDGHHAAHGQPSLLSLDEIRRLLRAFATLGMRKLRLTGGEPTLPQGPDRGHRAGGLGAGASTRSR